MTPAGIFSADFTTAPLWWRDAPLRGGDDRPVPERADAVVIGSGYGGLSAALELARAGLRVVVLDRGPLGHGASTRNGGMVGGAVKLDWAGLAQRYGTAQAAALLDGARASFEHLEDLVARERIDADYHRCGRFLLAANPKQFSELEGQIRALGERAADVRLVPRAEQRREIGSDFYHGGAVVNESGGLHPAKLHEGLRRTAERAGAALHGLAEVRRVERGSGRFVLDTARGRVSTEHVVVATNGYTGDLTPKLRRRVVPVSSYIIATEELPADLARQLSPQARMFVDGDRLLAYFRLSPDGRRVVFGGRFQLRDVGERIAARGLHQRMVVVWPALADYRVSHAWKGYLGFTFDGLPHMGVCEGVHFSLGCNGSGVAMATYLGHQVALAILGRQSRACPFAKLEFPSHPLYRGWAWFLPPLGLWYRLLDTLDGWHPRR